MLQQTKQQARNGRQGGRDRCLEKVGKITGSSEKMLDTLLVHNYAVSRRLSGGKLAPKLVYWYWYAASLRLFGDKLAPKLVYQKKITLFH